MSRGGGVFDACANKIDLLISFSDGYSNLVLRVDFASLNIAEFVYWLVLTFCGLFRVVSYVR